MKKNELLIDFEARKLNQTTDLTTKMSFNTTFYKMQQKELANSRS